MRKVFIGGNFKSNGNLNFMKSHFENVINKLKFDNTKCDVIVSPMNIHLGLVKELANSNIKIAAQNLSNYKEGAYTGEVSAISIKDFGIEWAILGHSERRTIFKESSDTVANKVKLAEEQNISSILCIGETKDERENNKTLNVIFSQLEAVSKLKPNWSNIVIAYEPVWAIGTGLTASPEQAQDVHQEIRKWLSTNVGDSVSQKTRIIYGGSVTDKNASTLIKQSDIDGFLVGGASLKPAFCDIVNSYQYKH